MITTNDDVLVARLGVLRAHGGTRTEEGMEFIDFGFNYRLNEIQAAMGLAQIDGFDAMLAARREKASVYSALLPEVAGLTQPLSAPSAGRRPEERRGGKEG